MGWTFVQPDLRIRLTHHPSGGAGFDVINTSPFAFVWNGEIVVEPKALRTWVLHIPP